MKRKVLYLFVLLTISFSNYNCVEDLRIGDSFLDQPSTKTALNKDSVFSKAETARYFLWQTYSDLYFGLVQKYDGTINHKFDGGMFEELSDHYQCEIGYTAANTVWYPGVYNQRYESEGSFRSKFPFVSSRVWEAVRNCWIFIENISDIPDMSEEEKSRLVAEAKIIIASRYFDIFRHFGGVPIIRKTADLTKKENSSITRGTVEETVNFMIELLDEAIATPSLPWGVRAEDVQNWDGRLTKGAAAGLKCKILLFAASPLFNNSEPYSRENPQEAVVNRHVWYGSYRPELWTRCLEACEYFFTENSNNGNYYQLSKTSGSNPEDYRKAFRMGYLYKGSNEILISTRCSEYASSYTRYNANFIFPDRVKKGVMLPCQDLVDCFPMSTGIPYDTTGLYLPQNPHNMNPFLDRDPRLYETVLVNGAEYKGRKAPKGGAELWEGGYEKSGREEDARGFKHGYALYKFMLDKTSMNNVPIQYPYLRFSEIYLIYAEALAETGNLSLAIQQVDIVRSRVGLLGLNECNPTLNLLSNKDNLIKEILRERSCELAAEDVRFFDMIRRKLKDDFTKMTYALKIQRLNADGSINSNPYKGSADERNGVPFPTRFEYKRVPMKESTAYPRSWWTTFSEKWYLSAMPSNEINKDYNLTQNPGW